MSQSGETSAAVSLSGGVSLDAPPPPLPAGLVPPPTPARWRIPSEETLAFLRVVVAAEEHEKTQAESATPPPPLMSKSGGG